MSRFFLGIGFLLFSGVALGQDLDFARQQVKKLTSPAFHGRGYVKNGDGIASKYLVNKFKKYKLKTFGSAYFQNYEFDVNTFPGKLDVIVDNHNLVPGMDFLVDPGSADCQGSFSLEKIDSSFLLKYSDAQSLTRVDFANKFLLLDTVGFYKQPSGKSIAEILIKNKLNAAGIAILTDKDLVYSVRIFQLSYCYLHIKRSSFPKDSKTIKLNIQSKFLTHKARNIIGFLPGSVDTFVVFTAHYDHLGQMGENAYFPGANDNASGTSMVLDFIRDYATSKVSHKYGYAFMLFSGEEAGLLGSKYYVANPLFPLNKIKMVINLDMVGTGSGGVTVFNGSNYPNEYHKLDSLNKAKEFNLNLRSKGGARNSDHYSFHEKKVPALFFLTEGKEVPYHSVNDKYEALPFTDYEKLYKLIYEYMKTL